MYVSNSRLPHVLSPSAYWSEESSKAEFAALFLKGWHLVGTTRELKQPGDFLTCNLFGIPIQVRNFDGQLHAVSNVCAHRHCLLSGKTTGHSENLKCQYHGWEYDATGRTRRIPEPKEFVPFDRDAARLPVYRVATCGQLVFVCISHESPQLEQFLGELFSVCSERFGENWEPSLVNDAAHACNWKVPVEGTLEAYHVPHVHPTTFKETPREAASVHELDERHTTFRTRLPFSPHSRFDAAFQSLEAWFLRLMGRTPSAEYCHHHCFPNLMFAFTDAVSLCHSVIPTGPASCRSVIRQFGYVGKSRGPRRWFARMWGRMAAGITRQIFLEDWALFEDVQQGLRGSPHTGMLGRCEERIHAFQVYVDREVSSLDRTEKTEETLEPQPFSNGVGVHS